MKTTDVLLLALMVLLPLAIQEAGAQDVDSPMASSPVAGGPMASVGDFASNFRAVLNCLDELGGQFGEFQEYIWGQRMNLKEIGCKLLANQAKDCRDAMKFIFGLDAGALDAACSSLRSFSPAGAPTAAN
ncbi:unnamed protein product [Victoria cruziana]